MMKHWGNIESEFEHEGLTCVVVASSRGYRCGYVRVPKESIYYGKDWIDDECGPLDVHGGITYGSKDDDDRSYWWLGFDCAHGQDGKDESLMSGKELEYHRECVSVYSSFDTGEIRTKKFVETECKSLAGQIAKLKGNE